MCDRLLLRKGLRDAIAVAGGRIGCAIAVCERTSGCAIAGFRGEVWECDRLLLRKGLQDAIAVSRGGVWDLRSLFVREGVGVRSLFVGEGVGVRSLFVGEGVEVQSLFLCLIGALVYVPTGREIGMRSPVFG